MITQQFRIMKQGMEGMVKVHSRVVRVGRVEQVEDFTQEVHSHLPIASSIIILPEKAVMEGDLPYLPIRRLRQARGERVAVFI